MHLFFLIWMGGDVLLRDYCLNKDLVSESRLGFRNAAGFQNRGLARISRMARRRIGGICISA